MDTLRQHNRTGDPGMKIAFSGSAFFDPSRNQVGSADGTGDKGIEGIIVQCRRRTHLLNPAFTDHGHPVCHAQGLFGIVGHHQGRNPQFALERQNIALSQEMAARNRLERKIIHISEEERRHLGHELHDGLCQYLTGARLHCSILEDRIADSPAAADLERLSELLDTSVASVNSALQRARATLADTGGVKETDTADPLDDDQQKLLDRYVAAVERAFS